MDPTPDELRFTSPTGLHINVGFKVSSTIKLFEQIPMFPFISVKESV